MVASVTLAPLCLQRARTDPRLQQLRVVLKPLPVPGIHEPDQRAQFLRQRPQLLRGALVLTASRYTESHRGVGGY
jgi:hypothetical protein